VGEVEIITGMQVMTGMEVITGIQVMFSSQDNSLKWEFSNHNTLSLRENLKEEKKKNRTESKIKSKTENKIESRIESRIVKSLSHHEKAGIYKICRIEQENLCAFREGI
jgi:hypothetical protein